MSVANLAYPQWYLVPCNKSLNVSVVCQSQFDNNAPISNSLATREIRCLRHYILLGSNCFYFMQHKYPNIKLNYTQEEEETAPDFQSNLFYFLKSVTEVNSLRSVFVTKKGRVLSLLHVYCMFGRIQFPEN